MAAGPVPEFVVEAAWNRVRESSGIAAYFRDTPTGSFHFHDLRHTNAMWNAMIGTDAYDLQRLLGHRNQAMTQRYLDFSKAMRNDGRRQILNAKMSLLLASSLPEGVTLETMKAEFAKIENAIPKPGLNQSTSAKKQGAVEVVVSNETTLP
jgi:hypothetical protein